MVRKAKALGVKRGNALTDLRRLRKRVMDDWKMWKVVLGNQFADQDKVRKRILIDYRTWSRMWAVIERDPQVQRLSKYGTARLVFHHSNPTRDPIDFGLKVANLVGQLAAEIQNRGND